MNASPDRQPDALASAGQASKCEPEGRWGWRSNDGRSTPRADATGHTRLLSIDALRGFVMLLIFAEVLESCVVAKSFPVSAFWQTLCEQQSHAEWVGWHLHDLIQPAFTFLVGVSMPLSIARRRALGESNQHLIRHAVLRAVILVILGIFVLSVHPRIILWKFEDTLTQIGLGYVFVFALAMAGPRWWRGGLIVILASVWLAFVIYPIAGPGYDFAAAGVTPDWLRQYGLEGFQAHWQKNANIAYAFDARFLPMFPGNEGYYAPKGTTTLNFVPTMATMILGLSAGHLLIAEQHSSRRLRTWLISGIAAVAAGIALDATGLCPLVKSLWTPSWVLFSGGVCFIALAAVHWIVDLQGHRKAFFVLTVVGSNSLAAYLLRHCYEAISWGALYRVFGKAPFEIFGTAVEPFVYGVAVMSLLWLCLYVMHRAGWQLRV